MRVYFAVLILGFFTTGCEGNGSDCRTASPTIQPVEMPQTIRLGEFPLVFAVEHTGCINESQAWYVLFSPTGQGPESELPPTSTTLNKGAVTEHFSIPRPTTRGKLQIGFTASSSNTKFVTNKWEIDVTP